VPFKIRYAWPGACQGAETSALTRRRNLPRFSTPPALTNTLDSPNSIFILLAVYWLWNGFFTAASNKAPPAKDAREQHTMTISLSQLIILVIGSAATISMLWILLNLTEQRMRKRSGHYGRKTQTHW
jgi:hypothetical protein